MFWRKYILKDMKNGYYVAIQMSKEIWCLCWTGQRFYAGLQNCICDFAVIKKTCIGKREIFTEKLYSIFSTLQVLIQTTVEKKCFSRVLWYLWGWQFHQKCVLVFINFIVKIEIRREVTDLGTLGSLRIYLTLFNSHIHFKKLGHLSYGCYYVCLLCYLFSTT